MRRRMWIAWTADAAALAVAYVVFVPVGERAVGLESRTVFLAWVAVASATVLVVAAACGRRPPRALGAGFVVLALVIPAVAALDVSPSMRIGAVALGVAFPLAVATFTMRVFGQASRLAIGTLVVVTVADVGARLFLRDPFLDLRCSPYCRDNPLLVSPRPNLVLTSDRLLVVATVGWCVIAVAGIVTTQAGLAARASAALAVAIAGLGAMTSLARTGLIVDDGSRAWALSLLVAALVPAFALAAVPELEVWRIRRRVRTLASDLSAGFEWGGVSGHLQRAMSDPSVRLVFPTGPGTFIDSRGEPTELATRSHLATTALARDGVPIALVEHATSSASLMGAAMNSAVTMAAENERLHAEAQAQLAELQQSRRRIVERADETRRHLERDLHDGAQQQLLLLGLELSRAAQHTDDGEREHYLAAIQHARGALRELRRLVHDPLPPVLDEFGLVEALRSLAEESRVALLLELDAAPDHRPPLSVERVAYRVALSALSEAEAHGASTILVRLEERLGRFTMSILHDGVGTADHTDDEDRVGAVGGRLDVLQVDGEVSCVASFP